jgi:hypothetical protein
MSKQLTTQKETKSPGPSQEERDNVFNVIANNNNLFGEHLINQVTNSDPKALLGDSKVRLDATANAMVAMKLSAPRDEIEAALLAQMMAVNNATMECFRRSMSPNQTLEGLDIHLKHAQKLSKIYTDQVDMLEKYRGKHRPKMTVENVNVEAGGQAIVGNVQHSSDKADDDKKGE